MRCSDLRVRHSEGSELVISEAHSPAPRRLQRMRNGLSVTPAIGASSRPGAMRCGPICSSGSGLAGCLSTAGLLGNDDGGDLAVRRRRPIDAYGLLVDDAGVGRVLADRLDAVVATGFGLVHLALADHLAVAGDEVEVEAPVLSGLLAEVAGVATFLAHPLDAVGAAAVVCVALAAQDHFAIGGLERKIELAVDTGAAYEFSS